MLPERKNTAVLDSNEELAQFRHYAAFLTPEAFSLRLEREKKSLERQVAEREHFASILFPDIKTFLTPIIASTGMRRDSLAGKISGERQDTGKGHGKPVDRQLLHGLDLGLVVCRSIIEDRAWGNMSASPG